MARVRVQPRLIVISRGLVKSIEDKTAKLAAEALPSQIEAAANLYAENRGSKEKFRIHEEIGLVGDHIELYLEREKYDQDRNIDLEELAKYLNRYFRNRGVAFTVEFDLYELNGHGSTTSARPVTGQAGYGGCLSGQKTITLEPIQDTQGNQVVDSQEGSHLEGFLVTEESKEKETEPAVDGSDLDEVQLDGGGEDPVQSIADSVNVSSNIYGLGKNQTHLMSRMGEKIHNDVVEEIEEVLFIKFKDGMKTVPALMLGFDGQVDTLKKDKIFEIVQSQKLKKEKLWVLSNFRIIQPPEY